MKDNAGKKYIFNGDLKSADEFIEADSNKSRVFYEVIDGVPVYCEDHYERLQNSVKFYGYKFKLLQQEFKHQIARLIKENALENCNVKITVYYVNDMENYILYISESYYPSRQQFEEGVHLSLLNLVRSDPNAKVINKGYKDEVSKKIRDENSFEVLLVTNEGNITEGSRSNVFFVLGDKVVTAPGEAVLKGITRKYVIEACKRAGFEVVEKFLKVDMLKDINGLFISGTSINVLPVSSVDSYRYKSSENGIIRKISSIFNRMAEEYIARAKKE